MAGTGLVNRLFGALCARLDEKAGGEQRWVVTDPGPTGLVERHALVASTRSRYLAEIATNGRRAHEAVEHRSQATSRAQSLYEALRTLGDSSMPGPLERFGAAGLAGGSADSALLLLRAAYNDALEAVGTDGLALLRQWPAVAKSATDDQFAYTVRGKQVRGDNYVTSLSHNRVPKLAVPRFRDWGEQLTFLMQGEPAGLPSLPFSRRKME